MSKVAIMVVFVASIAASGAQGAIVNRKVIACEPSVLKPGGKEMVKLGPLNGYELAISRDEDRTSYFLVVQMPLPEMKPLMSRPQFARTRSLEITEATMGFPWLDGAPGNQRIFTRAGRYRVVVADALESDARDGFECTIDYAP